jgi:hypothetical protein
VAEAESSSFIVGQFSARHEDARYNPRFSQASDFIQAARRIAVQCAEQAQRSHPILMALEDCPLPTGDWVSDPQSENPS